MPFKVSYLLVGVALQYVYSVDGIRLAMKSQGKILYYHYNPHGDVIGISDQEGQTLAQYVYDAWGNIIQQNEQGLSVDTPFKYAGYMHDEETNLYDLMARYYHPTHGVFISVDPDPGDADDPITQNGYTYTNNNPVMGVNPDGHAPDGHAPWLAINAGFAIYDGYKAYKAGKSKTEIGWAVASSFVKIGHVKKVGKVLGLVNKSKKSQVGSYTIFYKSGKTYSGKGPKSRANQSAKYHANKHNDTVRRIHWTPAKSNREAYIQEHYRITKYGGPKSSQNYYSRHSPGRKYTGGK